MHAWIVGRTSRRRSRRRRRRRRRRRYGEIWTRPVAETEKEGGKTVTHLGERGGRGEGEGDESRVKERRG